MLGASLAALAVSALPTAGFAQATTPAGGDTAVQDVIVVGDDGVDGGRRRRRPVPRQERQ